MSISTQRIRRMLREEFPEAEQSMTGSGHIRLRFPNGTQVTCSASPSCPHFMSHVRQNVRRYTKRPGDQGSPGRPVSTKSDGDQTAKHIANGGRPR